MKQMAKFNFLLTDTLPFEIPLIYSNRSMYDFIQNHRTEWEDIDVDSKPKPTVPVYFTIKKNNDELRKIGLLHPLAQLQITKFIEKYDNFFINYFQQNQIFSIRTPKGINNIVKKVPDEYIEEIYNLINPVQENFSDYKNEFVNNYFALEKFPKITDFYKSNYIKDLELKYDYLLKTDYFSCFDSIYTHSIDWAYLTDKEIAKENLNKNNRFSAYLDNLTQAINYNETNGIVVGPEFSRTIAEFVLTRIDNNLFQQLNTENLLYKKDYEVIRYMDDFFIFFNDIKVGEKIEKHLSQVSAEYKLHLNNNKRYIEQKPFLRKHMWVVEVKRVLQNFFQYFEGEIGNQYYPYSQAYENIRLIVDKYEEQKSHIVAYIISTIERKKLIQKLLDKLENIKNDKLMYSHCAKIIDLLFYVQNLSITTDNTIKISRILLNIQKACKGNSTIEDLIFKKIFTTLKFNQDVLSELLNYIIVLTANSNDLPSQFLLESIKKNNDYFTLSVCTYYVITRNNNSLLYKSVIQEINNQIRIRIEAIKIRYSLENQPNIKNYNSIDSFVLSQHFYIIHDFYSCGILDTRNLNEIKKIKQKIKLKKPDPKKTLKNEFKFYNFFLEYIINFDKPFMRWDASYEEIVKRIYLKKHKTVNVY